MEGFSNATFGVVVLILNVHVFFLIVLIAVLKSIICNVPTTWSSKCYKPVSTTVIAQCVLDTAPSISSSDMLATSRPASLLFTDWQLSDAMKL